MGAVLAHHSHRRSRRSRRVPREGRACGRDRAPHGRGLPGTRAGRERAHVCGHDRRRVRRERGRAVCRPCGARLRVFGALPHPAVSWTLPGRSPRRLERADPRVPRTGAREPVSRRARHALRGRLREDRSHRDARVLARALQRLAQLQARGVSLHRRPGAGDAGARRLRVPPPGPGGAARVRAPGTVAPRGGARRWRAPGAVPPLGIPGDSRPAVRRARAPPGDGFPLRRGRSLVPRPQRRLTRVHAVATAL